MKTLWISFAVLAVLGCSSSPKPSALGGAIQTTDRVADEVQAAYQDGEEIRLLHLESMGLVDRLDFKTSKLLER